MEKPKEDTKKKIINNKTVPWNPWFGVLMALVFYGFASLFGTLLVYVYPALQHWSKVRSDNWINSSIVAQFLFVLIVELLIVGWVLAFIKLYKARFSVIGLRRPKASDPLYGLAAVPIYYVLYFIMVGVVSAFYNGLNVNQKQDVGFNSPSGAWQLIATFISLVLLPPIAEEILVRGFLYGSLRKGMFKIAELFKRPSDQPSKSVEDSPKSRKYTKYMPQFIAAVLTSLIFASAHLPEGAGGPLWIGAIDTFMLSMVLVYLREKTDGLWAGMTLHGIKNFVAYSIVFLVPLLSFHK
ncbi:MAG TPA: CPBP family intramembrane glutamic endopeptidase [Candidatus Saccharimonadales bacterium]